VQPRLSVPQGSGDNTFVLDLQNTTIAPQLTQRDQLVARHGVLRMVINPIQSSPPVTRITMRLENNARPLQASLSSLGGVVILPNSDVSGIQAPIIVKDPATIQAIELSADGGQLVIRANKPLSSYNNGWDRKTFAYRITLNGAKLDRRVREPEQGRNTPLQRVKLEQAAEQTVDVLIYPAAGVKIGELNQPSSSSLSLALGSSRTASSVSPGVSSAPAPTPIPVPSPANPRPAPSPTLPRVPRGRAVVVIDPGHGGPDPGAVGIRGLQEKRVVLPIAQEVAQLLDQQGVQAILTRPDDRDLDLEPRVQIANRASADVFVSIHANAISLSRPEVNGLETYYFSSGNRLAQVVHNTILQSVPVRDRGVRQARFYVIRRTAMPSILVEVGFVTGAEDSPRLATSQHRSQLAAAIARGILQYIKQSN
jgi:N-acetylmuramoyl-L-alanine amidase